MGYGSNQVLLKNGQVYTIKTAKTCYQCKLTIVPDSEAVYRDQKGKHRWNHRECFVDAKGNMML